MDIVIPATVNVDVNRLKIDGKNPNKMQESQLAALCENIKRYGFTVPIITNKDYVIADGQHRWMAAKQLGMTEVPVVALEIGEVDRRMLRQILNKLKGTHDEDLDIDEYKFIKENDSIEDFQKLMAMDQEDYSKLLDDINETPETIEQQLDNVPEIQAKGLVKLGDIWQLGNHRLMCGDSLDYDLVKNKLCKGQSIELLFTDPPYGISIVHGGKVGISNKMGFVGSNGIGKARKYKEVINDDKPFNPEFIMHYGNIKIIWGANNFASQLEDNSCWLVWDKKPPEGGGLDHNNFSDVELAWTNIKQKSCPIYRHIWAGMLRAGNRDEELKERIHPTQKPVGLLKQILEDFSSNNDIVLDLFGGSGSTLIACEQTGRKCFISEIDPYYCEVIIQRWETLTGQKAVFVENVLGGVSQ